MTSALRAFGQTGVFIVPHTATLSIKLDCTSSTNVFPRQHSFMEFFPIFSLFVVVFLHNPYSLADDKAWFGYNLLLKLKNTERGRVAQPEFKDNMTWHGMATIV